MTLTEVAPAPERLPATQATRNGPRHFPCFDGLRAFAAVCVVLIHTAFVSGFTVHNSLGIYTARLEIGVSVFFLISGFLLYRPFAAAHLAGTPSPDLGRFWVRRLLRIVPAYWLVLTITCYVMHVDAYAHGWQGTLILYGFGQIYFPGVVFKGVTQAWSLCTEMTFYLFLPMLAAVLVRRRRSLANQMVRELVALAVMIGVSFAFRAWALNEAVHHPGRVYGTMSDWLPANLDLFALGMFLAVTSAWLVERGRQPRWLWNPVMPYVSWALAGVCFWAVSHLHIPLGPLYQISPGKNLLKQTLYGTFAFFILLPAVFGHQEQGQLRWLLRNRVVAALGIVSYGVYLWHQAWVSMFLTWTGYRDFEMPWWQLLGAVGSLAIASATASYLIVERPILRLKDRLSWFDRPSTARRLALGAAAGMSDLLDLSEPTPSSSESLAPSGSPPRE